MNTQTPPLYIPKIIDASNLDYVFIYIVQLLLFSVQAEFS